MSDKNMWRPDRCPITQLPFFMWIHHPDLGLVPTYGGPYDSYTIPVVDEIPAGGADFHELEFTRHRFDHDEGAWVESEDPCMRVISDQRLIEFELAKEDLRLSDDPSIALAAVMRKFEIEIDLSACGSGLFEPSMTISAGYEDVVIFDTFATITADDIHREGE